MFWISTPLKSRGVFTTSVSLLQSGEFSAKKKTLLLSGKNSLKKIENKMKRKTKKKLHLLCGH